MESGALDPGRMLELVRRQPAWSLIAEGLLLVGLIGYLDYVTGSEIAFSIFYAVPIVLMVWGMGWKAGLGFSILSASVWLWADLVSGKSYSYALIPYWNAVVRLGFFLVIGFILSALRNALDREYLMARTDTLTGAANARQFEQAGADAIERLRMAKEPFTLACVDLDNFKQVNDRFGHARGDTVARLGGDEFGILLAGVGADTAKDVVGRIHEKLSLPALESETGVTASLGAVTVTKCPQSFDEVIQRADALMYEVKTSGKKRFVCGDFRPQAAGG